MLRDKPHIPTTHGAVRDQLSFMLIKSPTFEDPFFSWWECGDGLSAVRGRVGQHSQRAGRRSIAALIDLSTQVRKHFEADPTDSNGRAAEGRKLIFPMRNILDGLAALDE